MGVQDQRRRSLQSLHGPRRLTATGCSAEPEHFGDQELALIYIAKRLNEALRLETLLTEAGLDYLVEPDKYSGGIIFQSRTGGSVLLCRAGR